MRIEPTTIAHLQEWVGKTEVLHDQITVAPVNCLAATLDYPDLIIPNKPTALALPELWHWLYFLPHARQAEIGADGHPQRGGFLPPVPLPRRMWAGGRLDWPNPLNPLRVGNQIEKVSTIESVTHKAGRTGDLIFVLV
ncbi:MAG: acyl-CoA dehydrogenase, partial [Polynucleobacter sp.]|nr:acyl-CoA dehydrogenase [Polynucleobacter sp.]